jgi:hypothetical protein
MPLTHPWCASAAMLTHGSKASSCKRRPQTRAAAKRCPGCAAIAQVDVKPAKAQLQPICVGAQDAIKLQLLEMARNATITALEDLQSRIDALQQRPEVMHGYMEYHVSALPAAVGAQAAADGVQDADVRVRASAARGPQPAAGVPGVLMGQLPQVSPLPLLLSATDHVSRAAGCAACAGRDVCRGQRHVRVPGCVPAEGVPPALIPRLPWSSAFLAGCMCIPVLRGRLAAWLPKPGSMSCWQARWEPEQRHACEPPLK